MLTKDDFIRHILGEAPRTKARATKKDTGHIEGFDFADDAPDSEATEDTRFVTPLLQAGFGDGQGIPRATVIRSTDAVAKYIPDEVRYWPKTPTRPHHTLLIEANLTHRELLAIPAFKSRQLAHLDIAEDAVARLVAEALEGFQRGAESLDASALKGPKHETLCVVSIIDEREGHAGRLACFGTFNAKTEGLETFFLTEHARTWDRADARERLGLIYERQFKKLGEASWQEAFTTTDERKQAEKLLEVCTKKNVAEKDVQESILDLLDTIARGFGLRKKADAERRLRAFPLPGEHDIGIDSEERESKHGGINPFSGVTLRDDHSRLLGYIVYPLKTKAQAEKLRQHLEKHNRFHNVLVVYPDADQASIELWQGREQLTGKLRKGQSHKDAADVVNLLSRFFVVSKAKVRNQAELAQELAYRARYLRRLALRQLEDEPEKGPIRNLYNAFKVALVHDQKEDEFADAFAQTITYGLLTARWLGNDQLVTTGDRFTRLSALKFLPAASPILYDLFKSALSLKLDEQRGRLLWLVDDVADLLDRIDVNYVFGAGAKNFDTASDPVIHFYEPFLAAYDSKQKIQRGVFFTPRPVVSYIVRSVHDLLQKEFELEDGLGSTDTWGDVAKRVKGLKVPDGVSSTDPFVCVLDPATGTGTFLYECIEVIERTMKQRWCRELGALSLQDDRIVVRWRHYVASHLLPRLYGFELMMASYSVAHLKLSFKLAETGYTLTGSDRLHIYLTNALEPASATANPQLADLFATLASEAQQVCLIKEKKRFSVVIGNPPYSNFGRLNRIPFILKLLDEYKEGLNEKKLNLDDDFIKFVRFAQYVLAASRAGVFGMITNNSFVDGITHRQMRQSLLRTYGLVYVENLHGSAKKKEKAPDGSDDENVFDIQQGVAITLAVTSPNHECAQVLVGDLWGARAAKYAALRATTASTGSWTAAKLLAPHFFFAARNLEGGAEYSEFCGLKSMFGVSGNGIKTERDGVSIHFTKEEVEASVEDFQSLSEAALREKYQTGGDSRDWTVGKAKADVIEHKGQQFYRRLLYRPFDMRHTWYSGRTRGFIGTPAFPTMRHMQAGNVALVTTRQTAEKFDLLCTNNLVGHKSVAGYDINTAFPLYVFEEDSLNFHAVPHGAGRRPNFSAPFLEACAVALRVAQTSEHGLPSGLTPEDIFHYAYAVFYSPTYRQRYSEFLRIDFPRLPLTGDRELFRSLAKVGAELAGLHLMESARLDQLVTQFIGTFGTRGPEVERVSWSRDTVWLDKAQTTGFRGVHEAIWSFRIGGYQVCEKWLKDRKGRTLTQGDLVHYQRIVVALAETRRLTGEIDDVINRRGGWPGAFRMKASVQ